jgi:hypothetical protein
LAKVKDPRVESALLEALSQDDSAVIAGAYPFYIKKGKPGSEDALIEALYRFGNEEMAQNFLNSGDVKLEHAASEWATSHGFMTIMTPTFGGGRQQWGSAR